MSPANTELQVILRRLDTLMAAVEALKPEPRLLELEEAAERLGVSVDTVRRLCDRREIRYVQAAAGHAKRIALADVQAWIDRHAIPPLRATR